MKEHVLSKIEEAIQLEEDGYTFYTDKANSVGPGLVKKMFVALAGDEVRHKATFIEMREAFKNKVKFFRPEEIEIRHIPIFPQVTEEFERNKRFQRAAIDRSFGGTTVGDALNMAMSAERRSIDHYQAMLDDTEDLDLIVALEKIVIEEVVHLRLLEEQKEFLSKEGYWFDPTEFYEYRRVTEKDMREFLRDEGLDI